jgi:hypothetical protein
MDIRITNDPAKWEEYEEQRAIIIAEAKTRDEAIKKLIVLIKKLGL